MSAPRGCLLLGVWSGGVSAPGGVFALGVSSWGGICSGGHLLPGGGIPTCTEAEPPLWTESQTPIKTLPWPNFIVAGNKIVFQ